MAALSLWHFVAATLALPLYRAGFIRRSWVSRRRPTPELPLKLQTPLTIEIDPGHWLLPCDLGAIFITVRMPIIDQSIAEMQEFIAFEELPEAGSPSEKECWQDADLQRNQKDSSDQREQHLELPSKFNDYDTFPY